MRRLLIFVPIALMAQAPAPKPQTPTPDTAAAAGLTTDDEKIIYALGLSIQRSLHQFDLSPAEVGIVKRAISDGADGKPALDLNTWGPKIRAFATARAARIIEREKAASNAYVAKAALEPGAVKTPSGLVYREVKPGTGASPKPTDTVKVNYRGTLVNGTEFDSTYKRNEPAQLNLNSVIHCWSEGLPKMKVGGKAVLVCPSDIAYGDRGRPGIPGGAALTFEVELVDIVPPPVPETTPAPETAPAPAQPPGPKKSPTPEQPPAPDKPPAPDRQ